MRGHIRLRGNVWYAVLDIRDPNTGVRRRRWVSLPDCKGKRQAQLACSRLITEMQRGSYLEPTNTTIAGFLIIGFVTRRTRYPHVLLRLIEKRPATSFLS
jgi:hypothetical protein